MPWPLRRMWERPCGWYTYWVCFDVAAVSDEELAFLAGRYTIFWHSLFCAGTSNYMHGSTGLVRGTVWLRIITMHFSFRTAKLARIGYGTMKH